MHDAREQLKSDAPHTRVRVLVVLLVLPLLGGALVAGMADGYALTRWVLVLEPLLWLIACAVGLHLLVAGRSAYGTATLVGWLLFAATLRFPVQPKRPDVQVSLATAQCTEVRGTIRRALRVVSADWSDAPELPDQLAALDGDIVVLSDIPDHAVAAMAEALDGESPPHPPGAALFVRGEVRPCAGSASVPVPGGFAALVRLGADDTVPVVALHHASARDAEGLSASIRELASPYTIVLGSTLTHGTFRRTESLLMGARLTSAPHAPTWPARVGPVPTLPLYHTDRLWFGSGWRVTSVSAERLPGADRLALLARLEPK